MRPMLNRSRYPFGTAVIDALLTTAAIAALSKVLELKPKSLYDGYGLVLLGFFTFTCSSMANIAHSDSSAERRSARGTCGIIVFVFVLSVFISFIMKDDAAKVEADWFTLSIIMGLTMTPAALTLTGKGPRSHRTTTRL